MPLRLEEISPRVATIPNRFATFQNSLSRVSRLANFVVRSGGILLLIFILHQLFFWLAKDPEKAFNYATLVIDRIEIAWDIFGIIYNPFADLTNALVVPLWNALIYYVAEPAVFLVLEVFSLVFLRHKYRAPISEDSFPYGGFVCDASEASTAWCGRFSAYNERLMGGPSLSNEQSIAFGASPEAAARRLAQEAVNVTFSIAFARRLSEMSGTTEVDVPATDTTEIIGALDGVSTQSIVMGGSAADLLFGVLYNVFETSAVFIFDAIFLIVKTVFDIIKFLIKSGALQFIISIGIDFILIIGLEVALPMVFAGMDAVVCLFQLFLWNTWEEQLRCAEAKCFRGPDAAADWWMFTSVPVVIQRYGIVLEATLNSRTGRSMLGGGSGGGKFDVGVSDLEDVFPSLSASGCTACFVCRFPELRFLWFVTAVTVSLVNPDNFETSYGNITQKCMTNGSYYTDVLCGPRGSEQLSFAAWKTRYPHGHAQFDIDLVQSYASEMLLRGEQLGGAAGGQSGELAIETADSWFFRDQTLAHEDQAARFTYLMCKMWRESDAGAGADESPQMHSKFASGSIASITSAWAFESCKR